MRLIDADALEKMFEDECDGECIICPHYLKECTVTGELPIYSLKDLLVKIQTKYVCGLIRNAPTIDIQEIRVQNTSLNETLTMEGEDKDGERQ